MSTPLCESTWVMMATAVQNTLFDTFLCSFETIGFLLTSKIDR
jgi:hypothetical protein